MIRRTSKIILEILGIGVAGVVVLVLLAAWRLSSGPISIDFIAPYIEEDMASPDDAYFFKLGEVTLIWGGWSRSLTLQADGVKLYRRDGTLISSLPKIEIGLSAPALLAGDLAPTSLFLINPKLRLRRDADGVISFGLDDTQDLMSGDAADSVKDFVLGLAAKPNRDRPSGYLTDLRIINGDISVIDDRFDKVWNVPNATIILKRDRVGLYMDVEFALNFDSDVTTVHATGFYDRDLATVVLEAEFDNFIPRHIAWRVESLKFLSAVDIALNGRLSFAIDVNGRVVDVGFNVASGPGHFRNAAWYPDGLAIESVQAVGRVGDNLDRVEIDNLLIDFGGPALVVAGQVSNLRTVPSVDGDIAMSGVPIDDLDRLWPRGVGVGARKWVTKNLSDGMVTEIQATVRLRGTRTAPASLVLEKLDGTMKFHGATVEYLSPMPPVRAVSGTTKFGLDRFDIFIQGGAVGDLEIASGRIALKNLDRLPATATIDLMVTGPAGQVMALIDNKPLGYAKKLGISPADIRGRANVGVHLAFPMTKTLKLDDLGPRAEARISSLQWKNAFRGMDVEDGELTVKVDGKRMIAEGTVTVAATPVDLVWRENFRGAEYVTEVKATGSFPDRVIRHFVPKFANMMSGPVDAEVEYRVRRDGWSTLDVAGEVTRMTLSVPEIEWEKPAGVASQAKFQLTMQDGRPVELTSFQFFSDALDIRGSATFTAAGDEIETITIDELNAGLTNLSGSIVLDADGGKSIAIVGESLDLTGRFGEFFSIGKDDDDDALVAEGATYPGAGLDIDANIRRVYLDSTEHRYVDDVKFRMVERDDSLQSMAIEVKLPGGGQTFGLSVEPTGNIRYVSALTEDAGELFRLLGVVDTVKGGRFALTGQFDDAADDQALTAHVEVTDFRVVDAPVLARILTLASYTGIVDEMEGTGISFDRLAADIEMADGDITIENGRAHGPALGLTMNGAYYGEGDRFDLQGTIIPAYFFNSILGNIPVISDIFVGEEGGGTFAGAYTVTGSRDNPKITVNPLAALLPGVLRRIMTGGGKDASGLDYVYPYDDEKQILNK